jgi:hypothetical protein
MTYAIGNEATLGIACLGITHPHTSGRVKAFLRMPNAKVLGAYDASFWIPSSKPWGSKSDRKRRSFPIPTSMW